MCDVLRPSGHLQATKNIPPRGDLVPPRPLRALTRHCRSTMRTATEFRSSQYKNYVRNMYSQSFRGKGHGMRSRWCRWVEGGRRCAPHFPRPRGRLGRLAWRPHAGVVLCHPQCARRGAILGRAGACAGSRQMRARAMARAKRDISKIGNPEPLDFDKFVSDFRNFSKT